MWMGREASTLQFAVAFSILITHCASLTPAQSHDWYPRECCSGQDCAPVESMTRYLPDTGGRERLVVTTKHGTAFVPDKFPLRPSPDGRIHVCIDRDMTPDAFGDTKLKCLFVPPIF
jgi:hypothetical protein